MGSLEFDLGAASPLGKKCLAVLHEALERGLGTSEKVKASFKAWDDAFTRAHGQVLSKETVISNFREFSRKYLENESTDESRKILFELYTFYLLVLKILAVQHLIWNEKSIELTTDDRENALLAIENGRFFEETLNITNFPNDEYFSWYLHVFDATMNDMILSIHDAIHAIIEHDLVNSQDMFMDVPAAIFQALIPKKIRHDLGEFYTPPWLARLVIEETGFTGRPDQKALDPGCGTGTFLVAMIHQIKLQNQGEPNNVILDIILNNVIGFDVNPVSVIAAKVNYLLAILSLRPENLTRKIELPVLECDAMVDEPRVKDVDFILGNPPWIKWDFLSKEYKEKIDKLLFHDYVLYSYKGMKSGLGFAHDDICITFTYLCMDKFLKQGGILGFVLKQTLYKGIAAREFRKFAIEKREASGLASIPVKVLVVHDLRALKPFKSSAAADVEASIAIIKKGTPTTYPVPYITWKPAPRSRIDDRMDLDNIKAAATTELFEAMPEPSMDDIMAPWVLVNKSNATVVIPRGKNAYVARHGVVNDLNSVFFITISQKSEVLLTIQNQQIGKKKVQQVSADIEPDLIYPVLKPRHVKRWYVNGYYCMIVPHWQHGQSNETNLKNNFPKTYEYLLSFKNNLLGRSSRWFRGNNVPFYALFGIGEYTFKPYKVVWSSIGAIHAFAVAGPVTNAWFGTKPAIPDNTIGFCSFDAEAEAHYACAILNSSAVGAVLSTRSTGSKWGTSIAMINEIPIPLFDPLNPIHDVLSKLSLQAHDRAARKESTEQFQQDIDESVNSLFAARHE